MHLAYPSKAFVGRETASVALHRRVPVVSVSPSAALLRCPHQTAAAGRGPGAGVGRALTGCRHRALQMAPLTTQDAADGATNYVDAAAQPAAAVGRAVTAAE